MNKVAQVALVFVIMVESMRVLGWGLPWYFLGEVTCENWKETQSVPTRCSSRTLPRRACTLCSNKCAREFVMALRPMFTAFAWFQFASQRATQMALEFLWTWTCMLLAAPVWDYNASANRNFLPSDLILTIKLATNAKSYCISCTGIVSLEIAVELMQSLLASPVSANAW